MVRHSDSSIRVKPRGKRVSFRTTESTVGHHIQTLRDAPQQERLAKQFFRLYGPSGKHNIAAASVCTEPVSMELENAACKLGCEM